MLCVTRHWNANIIEEQGVVLFVWVCVWRVCVCPSACACSGVAVLEEGRKSTSFGGRRDFRNQPHTRTGDSFIWHSADLRISPYPCHLFSLSSIKDHHFNYQSISDYAHFFSWSTDLMELRNIWTLDVLVRSAQKRADCHSADWCPPLCLTRRESCHAGNRSGPSISLTRIQGAQGCCLTVRKHLYECARISTVYFLVYRGCMPSNTNTYWCSLLHMKLFFFFFLQAGPIKM